MFARLGLAAGDLFYRQVDVTDAGAVADFTSAAAEALGGIDVCVANAGIVERGAIVDLTPEAFRRQIDINLIGAVSGWDVGACFLADRPKVPVLYTSGQAIEPERWVPAGVFIAKPYQHNDILSACQRLLGNDCD